MHSFFSKNAKIIARFVLDEHQRRQFSNGPNLFSWMMAKWLLMDKLLAENWEIALSPNQDLENVFKVFSGIHHPMLLFNSDEISSALDALAQQAREISPHLDFSCSSIDVEAKLRALNQVFHSNEFGPAGHLEFYHISRSCMSCLLKQRKGIPISLAAVYLCLAKRIGLEICGINSPQFFLLKEKTTRTFIKCYPTIELMTGEQAAQFLTNEMNVIASAEALLTMESCTHVDWALRMLSNVAHSRRSTVHAERIDSIYFQIQSEISRIYLIQQQRMFPHQLTRE